MRENFADKILPNDMQPAATRRGSNSLSHPKKTSFFQGTRTSIRSPPLADGWRQRVRFAPLFLHTKKAADFLDCFHGADDEARTRYLHLGKVALYQMSYIRIFCCSVLTTVFIISNLPSIVNSFFRFFQEHFHFSQNEEKRPAQPPHSEAAPTGRNQKKNNRQYPSSSPIKINSQRSCDSIGPW